MANVLGAKKWKLDTAATLTTDKRVIQRIEWVPGAEGDNVRLTEYNGEEIIHYVGAFAEGLIGKQVFNMGDNGWPVTGLILAEITSGGVLHIWFKNS